MSVLVATDFSDNSQTAIRMAVHRANRRRQRLIVLHCLEAGVEKSASSQMAEPPQNFRARLWKEAKTQLEETIDELVPADQQPRGLELRVEFNETQAGIVETVKEMNAALVVLGATGRSRLTNFLIGGTAEEIIRRIDVPGLVTHGRATPGPFEHIVAPVDFTDCSRRSLKRAIEIAREDDAPLTVLHAFMLPGSETTFVPAQIPPETITSLESQARQNLEQFADSVDFHDIQWRTRLEIGSPDGVITDVVDNEQSDLVVMGTHGRRGVERLFLGSTATNVLRQMPCSVMTVRTR